MSRTDAIREGEWFPVTSPVKVSIIYYSSTGSVHTLADAAAVAAEKAGADVRVRRTPELAPDVAVRNNDAWVKNVADTRHIPEATPEDVVEADVVLFGTPTRYGNVAAQLKQFLATSRSARSS